MSSVGMLRNDAWKIGLFDAWTKGNRRSFASLRMTICLEAEFATGRLSLREEIAEAGAVGVGGHCGLDFQG